MPVSKGGKDSGSDGGYPAFLRRLAGGTPPVLVVCWGDDDYLAQELALNLAVAWERAGQACELESVEGRNALAAVLEKMGTPLLWAGISLLVWTGSGSSKLEGLKREEVEQLARAWGRRTNQVLVIRLESAPRKGTHLAKWAEETGVLVSLETLTGQARSDWIKRRVKELKIQLTPPVAQQLSEGVAPMGILAQDLEKLSLCVEPGELVQPEHLAALSQASVEVAVWDLGDALGQGRIARALEIINVQYAQGAGVFEFLGPWASGHRRVLRVATARDHEAIADIHPYVVKKIREQSGRAPARRLRAQLHRLAELDRACKSSVLNERVCAEHVIAGWNPKSGEPARK